MLLKWREQIALEVLRKFVAEYDRYPTVAEFSAALGVTDETARRRKKALVRAGILEEIANGIVRFPDRASHRMALLEKLCGQLEDYWKSGGYLPKRVRETLKELKERP